MELQMDHKKYFKTLVQNVDLREELKIKNQQLQACTNLLQEIEEKYPQTTKDMDKIKQVMMLKYTDAYESDGDDAATAADDNVDADANVNTNVHNEIDPNDAATKVAAATDSKSNDDAKAPRGFDISGLVRVGIAIERYEKLKERIKENTEFAKKCAYGCFGFCVVLLSGILISKYCNK